MFAVTRGFVTAGCWTSTYPTSDRRQTSLDRLW